MVCYKTTRRQIDTPRKNRLIGRISAGQTLTEAANKENIAVSTAGDIAKRYYQTGSTHSRPRSGRPSKVTERTKTHIIRNARKNRRKPFAELGLEAEPAVSEGTVRRILCPNQRKARVKWAKAVKSYSDEDWGKVIWSDECYVYLGDDRGRVYVTRRADETFEEDCLVPTFKQSTVRVMVWGCIMKDKKGPLIVLDYPGGKGGGMNAKRYQEQVLDGVLKGFYSQMKAERDSVKFQQDGAPSHTSKSTKRWLTTNHVTTFPHPSSSPDLSPIEPVWHDFKHHIRNSYPLPSTLEQLKSAVIAAWDVLTIEDINKHVRRMPDRVQAVLDAKGGHTPF